MLFFDLNNMKGKFQKTTHVCTNNKNCCSSFIRRRALNAYLLKEKECFNTFSIQIDALSDEKHFHHEQLDEQEQKIESTMVEMFEIDKTGHFCA